MSILKLPDELLDSIVEDTLQLSQRPILFLKSLRQVNHRFSRLHSILSDLFSKIQLIGNIEDIQNLTPEALINSGVANYVRDVVFLPPLYCCMTFENFQDIFTWCAKWETGIYHPSRIRHLIAEQPSIWRSAPKSPFLHTKEQLRIGFESYDAEAKASLEYIQDGQLVSHWSKILNLLPKATNFRFRMVDYYCIDVDLKPMRPDCITKPRDHPVSYPNSLIVDEATALSDLFVSSVFQMLAQIDRKPSSLSFKHQSCPLESGWVEMYNLERLDMSHLRDIEIDPSLSMFATQGYDYSQTRPAIKHMQEAIMSLLRGSAGSLETLRWQWPRGRWTCGPISLPRLHSLILGWSGPYITAPVFVEWIQALPNLQHFSVSGLSFTGSPPQEGHDDEDPEVDDEWASASRQDMKNVLDVLREHKTLRKGHISFDSNGNNYYFDFIKDAPTTQFQVLELEAAEEDLEEAYQYAEMSEWMSLYVSGHVGWHGIFDLEFTNH